MTAAFFAIVFMYDLFLASVVVRVDCPTRGAGPEPFEPMTLFSPNAPRSDDDERGGLIRNNDGARSFSAYPKSGPIRRQPELEEKIGDNGRNPDAATPCRDICVVISKSAPDNMSVLWLFCGYARCDAFNAINVAFSPPQATDGALVPF
jgi:hypothetical protein